jgi:hypothetical protein
MVCIVAIAAYGLFRVELRYISCFLIVLWLVGWSYVLTFAESTSVKWIRMVSVSMIISIGFPGLLSSAQAFRHVFDEKKPLHLEMAKELSNMGVKSGDEGANIGCSATAYWAHLLRVKIVAELFDDACGNWAQLGRDEKTRVMSALQKAGARFVVSPLPIHEEAENGWKRIGNTASMVYFFDGK